MVVHIRGGKGRKDRDLMLSPHLLKELRQHYRRLPKNRPAGCSPAAAGTPPIIRSPPKSSGTRVARPPNAPASVNRFTRTPFATMYPPGLCRALAARGW
jgi:integrase